MFIGVLLYLFNPLSKIYFVLILVFFLSKILFADRSKKHLYVLFACSYIVGSEVFLRMTKGNFFYETSKYLIIVFSLIGLFTSGMSKKTLPHVVYLLLLIPGVFVGFVNASYGSNIRTDIAFNLSGPVALGVASLFCFEKKLSVKEIDCVLAFMVLPLISTLVYLFLYTPDLRDVVTGTQSNFSASGGFGPNQVSTVLGFGVFILAVRFFVYSKNSFLLFYNSILLVLMAFRNIVTFSRGGVVTSLVIIIAFLFTVYNNNQSDRKKIVQGIIAFMVIVTVSWVVSSSQTMGFIDKRYSNRDASGRKKEDVTTGRTDLISFELNEFFKSPILGIGVGKVKQARSELEGVKAASHNEFSRVLAEHGALGVLAFLILLVTPLIYRVNNRGNIYSYSFYLFWFLTINHSSMRIAAPAFIYALSLLKVTYDKPIIHREQALKK